MNQLTIGILAHVDAGKTTLSEALLYFGGMIRKQGRVDHGDAFLDNYSLERERGITIFSKQAIIEHNNLRLNLLDTPGHVDFSAEMERTLRVLDIAVLVVSAADGIQAHTRTLFTLFERVGLPVFVFINKMDLGGERAKLLKDLNTAFSPGFVDFTEGTEPEGIREELAVLDDKLLERFLETGESPGVDEIKQLIRRRRLFPCYFGSALKGEGVEALLDGLESYAPMPEYKAEFAARVFKIQRDEKQNRLTYLKITGGSLSVKEVLMPYDEKIDQIRVYNGTRYETLKEAGPGAVAAVCGISKSRVGDLLGAEKEPYEPSLTPVLNYSVICPAGVSSSVMLSYLRILEEEDPSLHVVWDEEKREIRLNLMGQVQLEIIKNLMKERFDTQIGFREGSIIYKETILNTVEGVGHFEPLRHYAEVHLLLEPLERGSGVVIENGCLPDTLSGNFQRLVLTHLAERTFKGVLTGSEITDIRITLVTGKAHIKHTEGGDFRQATYRAVRQGLMQAASVLLEPWYDFALLVPDEAVGHALNDLDKMEAVFGIESQGEGGRTVIKGSCPARTCVNYADEVRKYTGARGELELRYSGYRECANEQEIIEASGYEPERDLRNSPDSVFCQHGAGVVIPWYLVFDYMHLPSVLSGGIKRRTPVNAPSREVKLKKALSTEEIDKIIEQTYYSNRKAGKRAEKKKDAGYELKKAWKAAKSSPEKPEFILVDGYNVIFAWQELSELARLNIDSARDALVDILGNYQGLKGCEVAVVFDAYRVEGHGIESLDFGNVHVIYTKEAQTADGFIEHFTHSRGSDYSVTVVTSDSTEQIIAAGAGSRIISSRDFQNEVISLSREASAEYLPKNQSGINTLSDSLKDVEI